MAAAGTLGRVLRHPAFPAILSFLVAVLVYAVCLRNDFVYDDLFLLKMDDRIAEPAKWGRYWTESYNGGVDNLYRPLVSMSYAIQWKLHGERAWPYFAFNILLHAGCAAAVAELARRLILRLASNGLATPRSLSPIRAAYLAGLLFAVHPVHAEVVAGVVGRAESMCALFAIGSFILLLGRVTTARAVAIWLLATFSLLCKEHALLLPLLMLLLTSLYGFSGDRRARLTLILLIAWTWAGYIVFRESILRFSWDRSLLDWVVQPLVRSPGVDRWLWPVAILGHYAVLLIWPQRLSIDYGYAVIQPTIARDDLFLFIGAVVLVIWIALLIRAVRRRQRAMLFVLISTALTYGVIANLFTLIGTAMGERLIYLPSVFFIVLIAFLLGYARSTGVVLAAVVIGLGGWRTISYAAKFDDRLAFYEYSISAQPKSLKLRLLLASELMQRGRLDDATAAAGDARLVAPDAAEAWLQSAVIALAQNEFDEADRFFAEAIRLSPNPAKAAAMSQEVAAARERAASQPATAPSPK